MNEEKIPEDVWEGRCRWCVHRRLEENKPVDRRLIYNSAYAKDHLSCRIYGLAKCHEIPGECRSFAPNHIYGICKTCEYNNCFHEGYCTRDEQPNKRQVYIGHSAYNHKADYWQVHEMSTCDEYTPDSGWFETMRRQAAEGKIPRNFDPETMKMIAPHQENQMAEKWKEIDRILKEEAERERKQKEREKMWAAAEAREQIPGQVSIADLL